MENDFFDERKILHPEEDKEENKLQMISCPESENKKVIIPEEEDVAELRKSPPYFAQEEDTKVPYLGIKDNSRHNKMKISKSNITTRPIVKTDPSNESRVINYGDLVTLNVSLFKELYEVYIKDQFNSQAFVRKENAGESTDYLSYFRIFPSFPRNVQERIRKDKEYEVMADKSKEKAQISVYIEDLEREYNENLIYFNSLLGSPVYYGSTIQLIHEETQLFLGMSNLTFSLKDIEKAHIEGCPVKKKKIVELATSSSADTCFEIVPNKIMQIQEDNTVKNDHSFTLRIKDKNNPFTILYCTAAHIEERLYEEEKFVGKSKIIEEEKAGIGEEERKKNNLLLEEDKELDPKKEKDIIQKEKPIIYDGKTIFYSSNLKMDYEKSENNLFLLGNKKEMAYIKFRVIQPYSEENKNYPILQAVKIKNIDGIHYLGCDRKIETIFFTDELLNWNQVWIMKKVGEIKEMPDNNKEKDSSTEETEEKTINKIQVTLRLMISGQYLNIDNDSIKMTNKPEIFTLKYIENKNLSTNTVKIYDKLEKKNLQMREMKKGTNVYFKEDEEKITYNLFEHLSVSNDDLLFNSLCANFYYVIQKMIGPSLQGFDIRNIIRTINEMRYFFKNTFSKSMDMTYKVGFPAFDRIYLMNSFYQDKEKLFSLYYIQMVYEKAQNEDEKEVIILMTKLLQVLFINDGSVFNQVVNMLKNIFYFFDEFDKADFTTLLFNKLLRNTETTTRLSLKKKYLSFVQIIPKEKFIEEKFSPIIIHNMQKMILWRGDYDEYIQSQMNELYSNHSERFYKFALNQQPDGTFLFEHEAGINNLKMAIDTLILNANMAYEKKSKKYQELKQNFPFDNIMKYLKQKNGDKSVKYGLMRILNYCFINFPGRKRYLGCKAYCIENILDNFSQEFTEASTLKEDKKDQNQEEEETGLTESQIQQIWDLIITTLGGINKDFSESDLHIIYEILLIAYDFLRLNYIWNISDEGKVMTQKKFSRKPIERIISLVFRVLSMISLHCEDYFTLSKIREKNIQIKKDDQFNIGLKTSFYESSCIINHFIQKEKLPPYILILREMDEVICRIFLFYNKLRNKTLLLNFLNYLANNVEKFKYDKQTIFSELNFKFNQNVLSPLEEYCSTIDKQDGIETFFNDIEKFKYEMIREERKQFSLTDHMVMLINRVYPTDIALKFMAMSILMNDTREKTLIFRGLKTMTLLTIEEKEIYLNLRHLLYDELYPQLQTFNYSIFDDKKPKEIMRDSIIGVLDKIFKIFDWDSKKEECKEVLVQNIFRNLHGHSMLMKFLYKHKENILMKVQYKKNDILSNKLSNGWGVSYGEYMSIEESTDYLGKISKNIYLILRAFCYNIEKNKHLIWFWREYLLLVDNLDPEMKINMFYEIVRGNRKVKEWMDCSKYISNIGEQIEKSEIRENELFPKLMLKILAILLEILHCEQLFLHTEMLDKMIFITTFNYEAQKIRAAKSKNDKTEKFKAENLRQLIEIEFIVKYTFNNDTLLMDEEENKATEMDKIKQLVQDVDTYLKNNANEDYQDYAYFRLIKGLFFLYNKKYNHLLAKETELISNYKELKNKNKEFVDILELEEKWKQFDRSDAPVSKKIKVFFEKLEALALKRSPIFCCPPKGTTSVEEEKEESKSVEQEDLEDHTEKEDDKPDATVGGASSRPSIAIVTKKISELEIQNRIKKEKIQIIIKKVIEQEEDEFIIENDNGFMKDIKENLGKYFNSSETQLPYCYVEFLKDIIELYSRVQDDAVRYNSEVDNFVCFMQIFKKMLNNSTNEQRKNAVLMKFIKRVTTKLFQIKILEMIYGRLLELEQPSILLIQTHLLELLNILLSSDVALGQKLFLNILESGVKTEILLSYIQSMMSIFGEGIKYNNIVQYKQDEIFTFQDGFLAITNFVKNVYNFISAATNNQYSPFQNFFRQQTAVKKSINLVRMTLVFLKLSIDEIQDLNLIHIAIEPLRAILKVIQGPNEENNNVVTREIFIIASRIFSHLKIKKVDSISSIQIGPKENIKIQQDNFTIMKLKFYVTQILIELIEKSKHSADIYSMFSINITRKTIMKNFFIYSYLFHTYHNFNYRKDLLYNYLNEKTPKSYFVVEFGFQLSFLITAMKKIKEFQENDDYKPLFERVNFYLTQPTAVCDQIANCDFCPFPRSKPVFEDKDNEDKWEERMMELYYRLFKKYTGIIEIVKDGNSEIMYFPKNAESFEHKHTKKFKQQVDRSSAETRTEGIINQAPNIVHSVDIEFKIQKIINVVLLGSLIGSNMNFLQSFSIGISILLNILILIADTIDSNIEDMATISWYDSPYYVMTCGGILICLNFLIFFYELVRRVPLHYIKSHDPNWEHFKIKIRTMSTLDKITKFITSILTDIRLLYYASALAMSFLGLFVHPFFFCYQLSLIFVRSSVMQNLLQAIFGPILQIIMTILIMLLVIYYFSIYAYERFPNDFPSDSGKTLFHAFLASFDQTFKNDGGFSAYLTIAYKTEKKELNVERFFFDNIYAFIVVTLISEMISGIIVDKFKAMRENEENIDSDFNKECFICGRSRAILEMNTYMGFKLHIENIHNLFNYIFFIAYVLEKPKEELNSSETYILNMLYQKCQDWIPRPIEKS